MAQFTGFTTAAKAFVEAKRRREDRKSKLGLEDLRQKNRFEILEQEELDAQEKRDEEREHKRAEELRKGEARVEFGLFDELGIAPEKRDLLIELAGNEESAAMLNDQMERTADAELEEDKEVAHSFINLTNSVKNATTKAQKMFLIERKIEEGVIKDPEDLQKLTEWVNIQDPDMFDIMGISIRDTARAAIGLTTIVQKERKDDAVNLKFQARTILTEAKNQETIQGTMNVLNNARSDPALPPSVRREIEAVFPRPGQENIGREGFQPGFEPPVLDDNINRSLTRLSSEPVIPTQTSLIKNMDALGITDPKLRREIFIAAKTKPTVKINLNEGLDFKVPKGFMNDFVDGKKVGVKPIPGGPQDKLVAGNAAKTQMLKTALKAWEGGRSLVFDKDGSLNRENIFHAQFNTPFTEGRKLRNKMEFGIQAITRGETGAAMPPAEVENTRERFQPQFGDTVEIVKLKLDMFVDMLQGTLDLIDPTGTFMINDAGNEVEILKFNNQKFNAELERRLQGGARQKSKPTSRFKLKRVR